MSDGLENPYGVSLQKEKLRISPEFESKAPQDRLQLRSPLLETRGTGGGRPTQADRGLAQRFAEQTMSSAKVGIGSASNSSSDPSTFLRELSTLHVQGMFAMKRPANVGTRDLRENDSTFAGRGAQMATFISKTARRFGVRPGLLAEHLVAEEAFADLAEVPPNATLGEYLKVKKTTTSELGLDDFVADRKRIERAIPAAKAINRGSESDPMPGEAALRRAVERGATEEEINKLMKPQLKLPLGDAIAASAAYLRFKEEVAKKHISNFDTLPTEIQLQLVRLFVNPPSGKKNPRGINYIIREANAGRYMNLFDFSDRTAREASDTKKAVDVFRRATIHTARAIHLDREVLDDE